MQGNETPSQPQGAQYNVHQTTNKGQESGASFSNNNQSSYTPNQGGYPQQFNQQGANPNQAPQYPYMGNPSVNKNAPGNMYNKSYGVQPNQAAPAQANVSPVTNPHTSQGRQITHMQQGGPQGMQQGANYNAPHASTPNPTYQTMSPAQPTSGMAGMTHTLGPMLDADDAYTPSSNVLKPKVMAKGAFNRLMDMIESKLPPSTRQELNQEKNTSYEEYLQMKREENLAIQQSVRQSQAKYFKEYVSKLYVTNELNPEFTFNLLQFDALNSNALNFSYQFVQNMHRRLDPTLLLLLGGPGTGKTVACHAIAQEYIKLKYDVQVKDLRRPDLPLVAFIEFNDITAMKMNSFNDNSPDRAIHERRFDELCNVDILLIDDLCEDYNILSPFAQKILAEILSYRRDLSLPVVIASPVSNIDIADRVGIRSFERMNSFNVIATCLEGSSRRPHAIKIKKWEGKPPIPQNPNAPRVANGFRPTPNFSQSNQNMVSTNRAFTNMASQGMLPQNQVAQNMRSQSFAPKSMASQGNLEGNVGNTGNMGNVGNMSNIGSVGDLGNFPPNKPLELIPNDSLDFRAAQDINTTLGPFADLQQQHMPKIGDEMLAKANLNNQGFNNSNFAGNVGSFGNINTNANSNSNGPNGVYSALNSATQALTHGMGATLFSSNTSAPMKDPRTTPMDDAYIQEFNDSNLLNLQANEPLPPQPKVQGQNNNQGKLNAQASYQRANGQGINTSSEGQNSGSN